MCSECKTPPRTAVPELAIEVCVSDGEPPRLLVNGVDMAPLASGWDYRVVRDDSRGRSAELSLTCSVMLP